MLCQKCSKREATTHIKRVVNGEATETHLCPQCAQTLGYDGLFGGFDLSIPNIFSSLFGDIPILSSAKTERCEKCGCSFDDIVRSGMVGCADCYEKFYDKLLPSIQRIHGKTKHAGKKPPETLKAENVVKKKTKEEIIAEKEEAMKEAIGTQNFEQAAVLRDEIKALKEER